MLFKEGAYVKSNDTRRSVIVKENKACIELKNERNLKVIHYELDDGIIPKNESVYRCDRIVECLNDEDTIIVYAIELKGENVNHALEQLTSTVKLFFNPSYRAGCKPFTKACNETEIKALKGKMIRLKIVSNRPGSEVASRKRRQATHSIKYTKESMLRQECAKHEILFSIDSIVAKSGSSECI